MRGVALTDGVRFEGLALWPAEVAVPAVWFVAVPLPMSTGCCPEPFRARSRRWPEKQPHRRRIAYGPAQPRGIG